MTRQFVLAAIFVTAGLPVGCSTSGGGGGESDSSGGSSSSGSSGGIDSSAGCTASQGTTVAVKWDFAVSAATLNGGKGQVVPIHVCDTVEWTNDDNAVPHSVVSTGSFAFSTPQATGTTAGVLLGRVQFPTAGTFTYHCGVHLDMMKGQVTVQ